MEGEQGAGGEGEVLGAFLRPAAPAGCAVRTTAVVGLEAAAVWAHRLAVRLRPADQSEAGLGLFLRHASDADQVDGLGGGGEEEVGAHNVSQMTLQGHK